MGKSTRKTQTLLPAIFQTPKNTDFLEATLDQSHIVPEAIYEGIEFVVRMITTDTPEVQCGAGHLIDSSGNSSNITMSAHGTVRVVCGKNSDGDLKWYQI